MRKESVSLGKGVLLLFLFPAACRREAAVSRAPARPPADPAALSTLVDAEGIRRFGNRIEAGGAYEWELPAEPRGRLRFAWSSPERRGEVSLRVRVIPEGGSGPEQTVARVTRSFPAPPAEPAFWNEDIELTPGGRRGRLSFTLESPAPLFLSDLRLVRPSPRAGAVLLLVFDTTRRDAVGFGGSIHASSPNLDAILRDAWKADRAYAAGSWTIPSMASLLTGRVPAAHENANGSPLGIALGIPTLAEDFQRAGWSTAAFIANPTLRVDNGFARGFETFFTTPNQGSSIILPGRETLRHLPPWLAAHRDEPFFLLIHLLDPHDPYMRFDRPRGYTPFDPSYRGPIVGDEVDRLQAGELGPLPPEDVAHLVALYHDEVRLADEEFGRLWKAQPEEELRRWTVVFTSDHGEEFGEHGGWKHGPSLFDVVLRVPLAIRPGAGRRLPAIPPDALVSLLDLKPTLLELEGLPPSNRPLDGSSLLDSGTWRRQALPAATVLHGGAPRAVVVRKAGKLFFFDRLGTRGIPDPVKDPARYRRARRLPELLPALGTFDLRADPGERHLLPIDRVTFPSDWRAIERGMAHTRSGLELRFVSATSPSALDISIAGLTPEAKIEPFAFEENDRVSWRDDDSSRTLTARLDLSDGIDGLLLDDPAGVDLKLTVGGDGGCVDLLLDGVRPFPLPRGRTQTVQREAIPNTIPLFQTQGACAGLFLWRAAGRPRSLSPEEEEAWKKLGALGYLH